MCAGAFEDLCGRWQPTEVAWHDFWPLLVVIFTILQALHCTTIWAWESLCAFHTLRLGSRSDINGSSKANALWEMRGSQKDGGGSVWAFLARHCSNIVLVVAFWTWRTTIRGGHSFESPCRTRIAAYFASSWLFRTCRTFLANMGGTPVIFEKLGIGTG